MNRNRLSLLALILLAATVVVAADKNPVVGGQEMLPNNTIWQNLSRSSDHTTLVSAIKAAGLEQMLEGSKPITIFAPTNQAFAEMPEGLFDKLMKPENKEELKKTLLYNMLSGSMTTGELKKQIQASKNGMAEVTSMEGAKLKVADHNGMHLMIHSEDDDIGMFSIWDIRCSNGLIDVVDNVMQLKGIE
ncbi:MAG TPA: fasciclin domain-containing protein [Candidatus Angelobacter sp.]|nr:fasciclin domain-containing protein [Candidatus Angelobacter sp.]